MIIRRLFFGYEKEEETIRISFSIPFIFKLILTKHWGFQGALSIRLLVFNFYIGLYGGLGWSISQDLEKWAWCLRIHLKRVFIAFTVGIHLYSILEWRFWRLRKKLSPEKKERLKKILQSL